LCKSKSFVALTNVLVKTTATKPNGEQDAWLMKENGGGGYNNVAWVRDNG